MRAEYDFQGASKNPFIKHLLRKTLAPIPRQATANVAFIGRRRRLIR